MILQYTKALLEEIGKISDQIFPIVNFYNSVEHFNSLDIDIEKQTKYYNVLINSHFKHIDRCLESAKKINYIDFNNAIKDFLYDLNLKDNIHLKIYNEAEELFHSGKYDKSFQWIYSEMKLLQDNLLSQKTQLEKFQKNSQNEKVVLYFKIIEDGEIYPDTKNIDLKDLNNPLVLFETINNLEFLIDRINHVKLDVYEAFMPELNVAEKEIKDISEITDKHIDYGIKLYEEIKKFPHPRSPNPTFILMLFYCKRLKILNFKGEKVWKEYYNKIGIGEERSKNDFSKFNNQFDERIKQIQKFKKFELDNFYKAYPQLQEEINKDINESLPNNK